MRELTPLTKVKGGANKNPRDTSLDKYRKENLNETK